MDARRYLIDEPPILVLPSLAVVLKDLNKAIVLQQLHYWVQRSSNVRDGKAWVYNTTKEWQQQFPFWSESTIKRALRELRDDGVVVTANYNSMAIDRTLWYSIDYDKLDAIVRNQPTIGSDWHNPKGQSDTTNNQRIQPETSNAVVVEEAGLAEVFKAWDQVRPGFNFFDSEALKSMVDDYGADHVRQAIIDANKQGVKTIAYVEGILKRRAAGTEPQRKQQGSERKSKVEKSLDAVREYFAMKESMDAED